MRRTLLLLPEYLTLVIPGLELLNLILPGPMRAQVPVDSLRQPIIQTGDLIHFHILPKVLKVSILELIPQQAEPHMRLSPS